MAGQDKHKNRFTIKILGEEMVIVGDLSHEYVRNLAEHINKIGEEISRAYPSLSRNRILNLTIMNIADDYYKLKNAFKRKEADLKIAKEETEDIRAKYEEMKKEYEEFISLLEEEE